MINQIKQFFQKIISPDSTEIFETGFKRMEKVYQCILLKPFNPDGLKFKHILIAFVGLFLPVTAPLLSIISYVNNSNDIHEFIMCWLTVITAVQSIGKILAIYIYYGDCNKLREIVIKTTNLNGISDQNIRKIIQRYQIRLHKYLTLIIVAYFASLSSIILFPIVSAQKGLLPLTIKIPGLSRDDNTGYVIHYVMSTYDTIYALFFLIAYDGVVVLNAVYITCQLKICGYYFSTIGEFETSDFDNVEKQKKLLINSIIYHQKILDFSRINAKIYSIPALFQLIAATLSLCVSLIRMKIVSLALIKHILS